MNLQTCVGVIDQLNCKSGETADDTGENRDHASQSIARASLLQIVIMRMCFCSKRVNL